MIGAASGMKREFPQLARVRALSMLSEAALTHLFNYAGNAEGGFLEVGPYIGGSTLALALGNSSGYPHVAIEMGGAYDHPHLPTKDIIADLKQNLERFGVLSRVQILQGFAQDSGPRVSAKKFLGNIGLFFMDADGKIGDVMPGYAQLMTPNCLLALDDYDCEGAPEKGLAVRAFVDAQVALGRLIPDRLIDGAWFGHLAGEEARDALASSFRPYRSDEGFAYVCTLPEYPGTDGDHLLDNEISKLDLHEDGVPLGPPHAFHAEIRELGHGRFSHWGNQIWFSSSDGSDPNTNGRHYHAVYDGRAWLLSV